ncbi:MAG: CheY-like [Rhodospirillaceae bacterium]|nr:MAG: CheY-like [Rhodospirillaceae bacterium]TNC96429.1 MAG: CheY-like receiver [Stygiobacter sp.]
MPTSILKRSESILIVDDEMFSRFMTAELFQRIGQPNIVSRRSQAEAMDYLRQEDAALLRLAVLDVQLPDGTGLDILRAIRCGRVAAPHDLPVMIVTGQDSLGVVAAAMALDVDFFLAKPLVAASLRDYLTFLLNTPRKLSTAADYARIDVSGIGTIAVPGNDGDPGDLGPAITVACRDLCPGMRLAADVMAPTGELLVQRHTVLSERLIRLLHGLESAGLPVGALHIEVTDGA